MPIAKLFVEGALEIELLTPILQGSPVPQQGGSKNSLKPRARTERRDNKVVSGYLRDRDFDFDPPIDLSRPTEDGVDSGVPFGWRWCRHEIENYLIDPALVSEAMNLSKADVEQALRQAAKTIRNYEAARWTIGMVRRVLPPHYELKTRPAGLNDIGVPAALESAAVNAWALNTIEDHRRPMVAATDTTSVEASLADFAGRFNEAFIADLSGVLLWFSGKDMLAGLADWLISKGIANPGAFRAALRDWIIANPERALELLPEWRGMIEVVRA
jgi:hypothetical protein